MATWFETSALDSLLSYIKTNATHVWLLDDYTQGQNYATVQGNKIGEAAITSGDFTGPSASGNNRTMDFNGKSGSATANSTLADLHIAIVSGTEVLAVTNETSKQSITNGNPITFPLFSMDVNQPTQV